MVRTALPALAVNDDGEETYCEHHPVHTEECGYAEAVEGQPCNHEHDDECGYVEAVAAVEEQKCNHVHDENCGEEEQDCTHEHDEECGYVKGAEAVEGQPCNHVHDEECGYVEAVEGQPCQFVCEICEGSEEETEQAVVMSAADPRIVQEEGLIAHFTFDKGHRLFDSSGKGVKADLYGLENKKGDEDLYDNWQVSDTPIGGSDLEDYFDGTVEDGTADALHLDNNACLVLQETADFNTMTEMTVEMRIRITKDEEQGQNWLFYAVPDAVPQDETKNFLGAFINPEKKINIARTINNGIQDGEKGIISADFLNGTGGYQYDEWYTVRAIYKPSNVALYINDKRVIDQPMRNKTSDYFGMDQTKGEYKTLWFGHSAWVKDTGFNGYIDDIKIYNYANYKKSEGGYLDGYIDEQKYIRPSVEPANTTVHMFDYWIIDQLDNDYDPPLELDRILNNGINKDHPFLFAGSNGSVYGDIDNTNKVGSWNNYYFDQPYVIGGAPAGSSVKRALYEPFSGIVNSILGDDGYPQLALDRLEKDDHDLYVAPDDVWYESDKMTESLAYLFDPYKDNKDKGGGKASYPNVTGLFRLNGDGYYYFDCNETFAELNREQNRRPKESTDNNRITLYERESKFKDFFPFNDATDLFYFQLGEGGKDGDLTKAHGTNMGDQATTDEPFNHYFGMTVETKFKQPTDGKIDRPEGSEDMEFQFSGDDDVWIFIDDVLVADLGGLHNEVSVDINFATGEIAFGGKVEMEGNNGEIITIDKNLDGKDDGGDRTCFDTTLREMFEKAYEDNGIEWDENEWNENNPKLFADGSVHRLKFFYLERGNAASRCAIKFNLQYVEDNPTDKPSKKDKTPEEQLPDGDNTPEEQWSEEIVTLNVSADVPKENGEAVPAGVLASPNTGDSNMVGLWLALLALSTAGIIGAYRTRRHGNK